MVHLITGSEGQVMRKPVAWHNATPADWEVARQREAVVRPLAARPSLTPAIVSETARTLNLRRSLVYQLVARYRKRPQTSTLLLGQSGRPRGSRFLQPEREAVIEDTIQQYYLTRERPRIADLMREIGAVCRQQNLKPPNYRSVKRRLNCLDPSIVMKARVGGKAAASVFRPVGVPTTRSILPMDLVQIDHTPVDVIVVDERDRLPIGRPWLSLAIDVATRTVPGFCVSLEPPSTISVALVLTHAVLPKDGWLADRDLRIPWPVAGLPEALHLDNAPEFHAESLTRAAQEYGIRLEYRPLGRPHFGGHIERLIGTTMGAVHLLPGTTFSNVADKGDYPSEKSAVLTLAELEVFIALQIAGVYHQSVHSSLQRSPMQAWNETLTKRSRPVRQPINPMEFFFDFLPDERRLVRRDGIRLFNIHYWDNYLSPLAGRSEEPLVVKYDPRNLSRIYLRDDAGHYWPIPYRDLALPPISLWEHREAMKRLRQDGRRAVDERLIFSTILEQRKLVDAARRTARQRRAVERIRPLVSSTTNPASVTSQVEQASEITPFPVEEWS
jgi:putative transposase